MLKAVFGSSFLVMGVAASFLSFSSSPNENSNGLADPAVPTIERNVVDSRSVSSPSEDGEKTAISKGENAPIENDVSLMADFSAKPSVSAEPIQVNGMVEFEDDIVLSALDSGRIDAMNVKEGSIVKVEQVVCQLNQRQLLSALASAKAQEQIAKIAADSQLDLATAETAVMYAGRAVKRVSNKSVFTEEERDQRHHEKARADQAVIQAKEDNLKSKQEYQLRKAEVAIAKLRLEERNVKSPIAGMVISVDAKKGEWVNEGQPIVRVVRLDRVRISASLSQSEVEKIEVGSQATFYRQTSPSAKPDEYQGKVVFISPEFDVKLDGIRVFVEIDSPKPLLRNHTGGTLVFGSGS